MGPRSVPFECGGHTHQLRFGLAAYRELDPEGKIEVADLFDLLEGPERFPRAFLAMLEFHRARSLPDLKPYTLEVAEELIDEGGYNAARAAALDALRLWLNPRSEVAGDPKAAPAPSAGPGETASLAS